MYENLAMQIFKNPSLLANRLLLVVCLMLPWLNPFTSAPSTSVIPLLLSWMMAACAFLLVVDEVPARQINWQRKWGAILIVWFLISALIVPEVIDRALTAGYFAAIVCIWISIQIGKRAANRDNELLSWVLAAWLIAALISSAFALLQRFDLAYYMAPWVNQSPAGVAFANLRQPNHFASLTGLGLVALFGLVSALQKISRLHQWAAWFSLFLLSAGVASSSSRTGAVQWVVINALVLSMAWKDRNNYQSLLISLALGGPILLILWSFTFPWIALQFNDVIGTSVLLRFSAANYSECGGRLVLWSNVLHLITYRPMQGWGLGEGDFAFFITNYQGERFCDLLDNAHNFPLHLALEFGIPFAIAFCAYTGLWILQCGAVLSQKNEKRIALGLLIIIGIHSMLEYPLWYGPFQITLGLAIGLMAVGGARDLVSNITKIQTSAILISVSFFLGCFYVALDYNQVAQIYKAPEKRDSAYRNNPIQNANQTWLFKNQVDFARLMTQSLTKENAQENYDLAIRLLHFSPEPRVAQRAIECLKLLGRNEDADRLSKHLKIPTLNQ